jgi:hypothetical protein
MAKARQTCAGAITLAAGRAGEADPSSEVERGRSLPGMIDRQGVIAKKHRNPVAPRRRFS